MTDHNKHRGLSENLKRAERLHMLSSGQVMLLILLLLLTIILLVFRRNSKMRKYCIQFVGLYHSKIIILSGFP